MEKAELEQQIKPNITEEAYVVLINDSWQPLIETAFSFVIADKKNRIVGVSLSFDVNNEPECNLDGPHGVIFEFLETLEAPVKFVFLLQFSFLLKKKIVLKWLPFFWIQSSITK